MSLLVKSQDWGLLVASTTTSIDISMASSLVLQLLQTLLLEGTSSFDAWLNASSFQISQVLLTLPYSFAQLGLASGVAYQLIYAILGCWSCYMTTSLYVMYRENLQKRGFPVNIPHTIQWHEVLDGLLGCTWKWTGLVFNAAYQFLTCVIFVAGCSSLAHLLDDHFDKRTWTLMTGGCFLLTAFIPKAQHYRLWSAIGIVATTYTAWYLTISTLFQDQEPKVQHTGPQSTEIYFVGATNILYAFGGHAVTIEIVDAMRRPKEFKMVYLYTIMYILTLTLPSAISVYLAFGDKMLQNPYALTVLPKSKFNSTAAVLMLIHQFMQFGFLSLPLFMKWEKLLGVYSSNNYFLKTISRFPVVLLMWFLGIMLPYIGLIDSVVGSFATAFSVYIIPCAAYMAVHRTSSSRKNATEQPPFWLPGWPGVFCLNTLVILWVLIFGAGFGGWSGISYLLHNVHTFGLFPKCYKC